MEIKITTNQVLKVLQILSWIIFIGLCIESGGIIVNTFITLLINPLGVKNFWEGNEYLSILYKFDRGHFIVINHVLSYCKTFYRQKAEDFPTFQYRIKTLYY
jgi:hypothetical protein